MKTPETVKNKKIKNKRRLRPVKEERVRTAFSNISKCANLFQNAWATFC